MLLAAGAEVTVRPTSVTVRPAERLSLGEVEVPGDFSSAAPFVVAATLVPRSEIHVHGVNLNPRRTGLLEILERMGANITVYNRRSIGGEPGGDLEIHSAPLVGTTVGATGVPLAIDELPLFALAAACARGESVLRGAEELRAKETDRIEATVDALRSLGARARARDDGFAITGVPARLRGGRIESRGDHRIAMLGAVAGLASREGVRIEGADAVGVSFPGFFEMVERLRRSTRTQGQWIGHGPSRVLRRRERDRGHRRPRRRRQELRCQGPRRAARVPLPRHGRDVPRTHVARVARGRPARRRPRPRGAREDASGHVRRRRAASRSRGRTSRPASASRRSTRPSRSSPAIRRCARSCAGASGSSAAPATR